MRAPNTQPNSDGSPVWAAPRETIICLGSAVAGSEPLHRQGRVLYRGGDDEGVVALDADLARQQAVHQALVVLEMGDDELADIVDTAADRPAFDDLGEGSNGALEAREVLAAVALQLHLDEDHGHRAESLERHFGLIALDDAGVLEPTQPLPARCRRKVHPFGKRCLGNATFALQYAEDLDVAGIEFDALDLGRADAGHWLSLCSEAQ